MSENQEVDQELRETLEEAKQMIILLETELSRLQAAPLLHATVVSSKNEFDLSVFEKGDRLLVIDRDAIKERQETGGYLYGSIASSHPSVTEDGYLTIEYPDGKRERYNVGLNGEVPQVKLIGKDDGTNVVIACGGQLYEVHGIPGKEFYVSETVKVDMTSRQIHDKVGSTAAGDVAYVKALLEDEKNEGVNHVEVEANGQQRVVLHATNAEIKPGDRVMLDQTSTVIVRILDNENKDRFTLMEESNVTWDQIAGLEDAKEALREAVELPYQHPKVFEYYNKKPPKGVLLSGPPGCGKTLTAKAVANSLAKIHGCHAFQSGFIYVKGSELLSKWVGHSEEQIRQLFTRAREHYQKHNYPALLFIDEADAILPVRGSGKSSDVENTIVPMFLSEMDGLTDSHCMVLLATNQPKRLDPAVIRDGRVDRHIRVRRPNVNNTPEYFAIHLEGVPFRKNLSLEKVIEQTTECLFSDERVLYNIGTRRSKEALPFRLSNCVTGAMIRGICDMATSRAMKRDLVVDKCRGVTLGDMTEAVDQMHRQMIDRNPMFDVEEFCEEHGFSREEATIKPVR